jgi:hypothetical protein
MGWKTREIRVRFPASVRHFPLLHSAQTLLNRYNDLLPRVKNGQREKLTIYLYLPLFLRI